MGLGPGGTTDQLGVSRSEEPQGCSVRDRSVKVQNWSKLCSWGIPTPILGVKCLLLYFRGFVNYMGSNVPTIIIVIVDYKNILNDIRSVPRCDSSQDLL